LAHSPHILAKESRGLMKKRREKGKKVLSDAAPDYVRKLIL
jgi:hypothetical protein